MPNLRGHYQSGRHRGDVDYIGQLEDDIADLIDQLRRQNFHGPVVLGGHSSGGGFGIRFAGGRHAHLVSRFLLLSPVIPRSDTIRQRSAGGWAHLHMRRIIGLALLNAFGIRGFNALPVIEFNKPVRFWDGTETLTYSYRLNTSYHPRGRFVADVRKLTERSAIFIGELDEAVDAQCLARMIKRESPATALEVLAGMDHFGVFTDTAVHEMIIEWIAQRASTPLPRNAPIVAGEIGANGGFR
ncbi:alpha/beta fold hydrolase [Paraburkholderia phytofirmans]|uniref:alpha/beta fold hydrolase n=1 Tax=Paraburkholderia phytofirmans TaxID=261302 RepID=UPI0038BB5AA1